MDKHKIKRRLKRLEEKLKVYNVPNPEDKFTFFGGWDKGYLEGQIRILEEYLDSEENNEEQNDISFEGRIQHFYERNDDLIILHKDKKDLIKYGSTYEVTLKEKYDKN